VRVRSVVGTLVAVGVLAALAFLAVPAVLHSDAATTTSVVAGAAPQQLPAGPLPAAVRTRWSAPGAAEVGSGTVVVADSSGVAGRDPLTGAQRWSYHRGNARLCDWTSRDGVVVAVFGKRHGCTEMTALDAGTGVRRWYRTAELGAEVDLTSAPGTVVARSGDQLIAVDTASGLNRWTARKPGCRYQPVAVGGLGAVAVLDCGARTLLVSHDPYLDKQRWSRPVPGTRPVVLAVTDQRVAVLSGDRGGTLSVYDGSGHRLALVTDPRMASPAAGGQPPGLSVGGLLLYWTGRSVVALDPAAGAVRWAAPASGPPVPDADRVLCAVPGGFAELSPKTGRQVRRIAAGEDGAGPPRGALLARVGRLVVAAGDAETTVSG